MSRYDYTTIGISPPYRDLINELADYHGLKTLEFVPLLILAYATMSPEGRETILDMGSTIIKHHTSGMGLVFGDSLELSEDCMTEIYNVKTD